MTMKIFIALTSREDFWDIKSEKICFLGEWCKIYSRKDFWEKLNYCDFEYLWNSVDKKEKAL